MQETDNHNFNKYDQGEDDWTHRDDFQALEERVPVRDVEGNLGTYTPHDGARFEATDTGREFLGDGNTWTRVASTGEDPTFEAIQFNESFRDPGRYERVYLNTFNVGGNDKQTEVIHRPGDYTDKPINKILIFCEHLSVYTSTGGDQTFAVQINDLTGTNYNNIRVDGTSTTNTYAIIGKNAGNTHPQMGHVYFHTDRDHMVYPQGAPRGAGIDGNIDHAVISNPQTDRPFTIDKLRFFTPDGDEIRMRRCTIHGFTEGVN